MAMPRGLVDNNFPGWVLQTFEMPMPPGMEKILEAIKTCLSQKQVQSVKLEMGRPISYTRLIPESEAKVQQQIEEETEMNLGAVARNVQMGESSDMPARGEEPNLVIKLFMMFELRRLFVTHIAFGPESVFFRWLQVDPMIYGAIEYFLGAKVVREKDIPDDAMILFGGTRPGGPTSEITYAMKCHLLVVEEGDERQDAAGQPVGGGNHSKERRTADGAVAGNPKG